MYGFRFEAVKNSRHNIQSILACGKQTAIILFQCLCLNSVDSAVAGKVCGVQLCLCIEIEL